MKCDKCGQAVDVNADGDTIAAMKPVVRCFEEMPHTPGVVLWRIYENGSGDYARDTGEASHVEPGYWPTDYKLSHAFVEFPAFEWDARAAALRKPEPQDERIEITMHGGKVQYGGGWNHVTAMSEPGFVDYEYADGTRSVHPRLPNPAGGPALVPVAWWKKGGAE